MRRGTSSVRFVVDGLSSILIAADPDGMIKLWNESAAHITGIDVDSAQAASLWDLDLGWDRELVRSAVKQSLATGSRVPIEELQIAPPGRNPRTLGAHVNPLRDSGGGWSGFALSASDLTEQRHLDQRLEAVGALATGLAHEINTPIQFIADNLRFVQRTIGNLSRLLGTLEPVAELLPAELHPESAATSFHEALHEADIPFLQAELPAALEETLDGVHRIRDIVAAMKDFSHPGSDEPVPADLNRALENTLTVARHETKQVADVVTDFADIPLVPCYPADLNIVFLNLVVNAAHAIGDAIEKGHRERGTISVRTRLDQDQVIVEIQDTGTGIPVRCRERIFDPFFTTKPAGRGTGQGLPIARNVVVTRHRGTLTFDTREGEGTTFIITLPITRNASES